MLVPGIWRSIGTRHMCSMHSQMHIHIGKLPFSQFLLAFLSKKEHPVFPGNWGGRKLFFEPQKSKQMCRNVFWRKILACKSKTRNSKATPGKKVICNIIRRSKNRRGSKKAIMNLQPRKICLLRNYHRKESHTHCFIPL